MPIEILMPALSPTMEEGTLSKWMVKEGDSVNSGDLLAEIETDKATMEVEAVEEGVIAKLLVPAGSEGVKVNAPIALLLEEGETASSLDGYRAGGESEVAQNKINSDEKQNAESPASSSPISSKDSANISGQSVSGREKSGTSNSDALNSDALNSGRIKASPLAKRLAKDAGIDLSKVQGSGPNGRIIKVDIEAAKQDGTARAEVTDNTEVKSLTGSQNTHVETKVSSETTELGVLRGGGASYLEKMGIEAGTYRLEPLDGMRRTIAKRLTSSNVNVPDFPLTIDCEIDALLAMRKELNGQAPEGVKISVNDMLIRASALALKNLPEANASFTPDGIAYHNHADVAVAVAIEGGLITPIVRQSENKGLSTISSEMKDLAVRARDKKLKPTEYQGGTFSISNLGMFGIREFGSIINEPHGMILSVGAGAPRAVVKEGAVAVATVMTVTLTCDHRVVDGALGAKWLQVFKRYVEQPITMML